MLVWRKLSAAKWEDAWLERLSFLGGQRLVITALARAKTIRIEAYALSSKEAAQLTKHFGGQVRALKKRDFVAEDTAPRAPLRVRDRLLVVRTPAEKKRLAVEFPQRQVLVIPAALAFGTGDHATTATALRLLCDLSGELSGQPWELLDLGTGSGILAIAARALGARRVVAGDFDPVCVRTAQENVTANQIDRVQVKRLDITKWTPARTWLVVTANLYSSLLIGAAPQLFRAVSPGGTLLFSGILRAQERDCVEAFQQAQFQIERLIRQGKWVTGRARRPA